MTNVNDLKIKFLENVNKANVSNKSVNIIFFDKKRKYHIYQKILTKVNFFFRRKYRS